MRVGVRLGPVWVSTSTRSRSRPRQPSWHAKGHAMTPDGRDVDFRCHHNHRTQSAAISCASVIRKQIERGQSLHLVTRVRSTPASRESERQRATQKEAIRQAKVTQRAQAARQRVEEREARRQAKITKRAEAAQRRQSAAQQREALAQQQSQKIKEQRAWQEQIQTQRVERREQPAYQRTEKWAEARHQSEERRDTVHHRHAGRTHRRRSRSWPVSGLVVAGVTILLGVVLAGIAGKNAHSPVAPIAGALLVFGFIGALVCAIAALWRRLGESKRSQESHLTMGSQPATVVSRQLTDFANSAGYVPSANRGGAAGDWHNREL